MTIRSASRSALFLALAALAGCAGGPGASPYAGQEARAIKALSPKDIADLRQGAGMGYAKAAELNGYPGPMHVLELSERLALSASQRAAVEAILAAHKAEARELGAEVVRLEAQLDELFAKQAPTAENVDAVVARLASASGTLRASHLKAHITTTRALSGEQVALYVQLRGYGGHHGGH